MVRYTHTKGDTQIRLSVNAKTIATTKAQKGSGNGLGSAPMSLMA